MEGHPESEFFRAWWLRARRRKDEFRRAPTPLRKQVGGAAQWNEGSNAIAPVSMAIENATDHGG